MNLDRALLCLLRAGIACESRDDVGVRGHLRDAAEHLGVFLDVPGVSHGSLRPVQSACVAAANALCVAREPAALSDGEAGEALERAQALVVMAWERTNGRSAA